MNTKSIGAALLKWLGLESHPLPRNDNTWPDIRRDYPDSARPGLVHRVRDDQIWLDPQDIFAARKKWDEEHK
jgi:hypothetical protein